MILGYTLTTFPNSLIQTENNKKNHTHSTKLRAVEGPCIIGGEYPDNRFSTQRGNNRTKIRKEKIHNPQNNRKKDNTKFCILFFIYI